MKVSSNLGGRLWRHKPSTNQVIPISLLFMFTAARSQLRGYFANFAPFFAILPHLCRMFRVRTVSALSRAAAEGHLKRLLFSRRLRSTVTEQWQADSERSRGGAPRASAQSQPPGKSGKTAKDRITSASAANTISVNFEGTREAYKSKDSLELLRSLVVFKLCSYDFLVDNNTEVWRSLTLAIQFSHLENWCVVR